MKTAEELGIDPRVHDGLAWFVDCAENGVIGGHGNKFDMASVVYRDGCGTACCIGGWVATYLTGSVPDEDGTYHTDEESDDFESIHSELHEAEMKSRALENLFYMYNTHRTFEDVTLQIAVTVTRHYLDTGIVDWDTAIQDARKAAHADARTAG